MSTNTTLTRQDAASIINAQFTTATRPDGSIYITADDASDARQLVRKVHFDIFDGILPNDWVYSKISEIVNSFAAGADENGEVADQSVDLYTSDLYAWINDNLLFAAFVNENMEYEHFTSIDEAISRGQYDALCQMTDCISAWLDAYADTRSDATAWPECRKCGQLIGQHVATRYGTEWEHMECPA